LWGQTLNIHGNVSCGFGMFTWGDLNAGVTTINMYTNSSLSLRDTLAFGTAWWFAGGPNVVMNMYDNAKLNVAWFQFGAKLNLYGGTVIVTNGLNTGTPTGPVFVGGVDTDATRAINLAGPAQLVLPAAYTNTVYDWIVRGILQVYGVPGDAGSIVIDEANTNWPGLTVVTTTATGPNPILAVRIEVPRPNLFVGGVEQAQVYADYATTTNVNITTLATVAKTYTSSATGVATISASGLVRAVGSGTSTLTVVVGTLSNTVSVAVGPYTNNVTSLLHRYSFSETEGTTAVDSIGGTAGDGTYNGTIVLNGSQLDLNGVDGYVQLPAGIVTNLEAITIETWASFAPSNGNWSVLFTFGDMDATSGLGHHYISCQPRTAVATAQIGIADANPGYAHEQDSWFAPILDGMTNLHIVAVYHPLVGYLSFYTNGTLAAINSSITIPLANALSTGAPLNFIGRSLYTGFALTVPDPYLVALVDEFRIYSGALTPGQIKANAALGPNQLVGTSTSVSLAATLAGANLVISWPTNSALVNLQSSPVLGSAAAWTSVSAGTLAIEGANYKWTLPATGSAQYFRLQK
jgi:hypothetical protein